MDYSRKDFTGRTLIECTDLNGQYIHNSCFSQEQPNTRIFPDDMTGVKFEYCNLENVFIPMGNTVINCETRQYKVQNDLNDWEIDDNGYPTTVINWLYFYKNNIPHPNPSDIPDHQVEDRIILEDTVRNVRF